MPKNKPAKMPKQKESVDCLYRFAVINRADISEEDRSLPIVLATETPVETYDWRMGEIVDEVIRLDGMEIPKQVPLLDSHDRFSVRNVLGSIRELKVENGNLIGRAFFASDESSANTFRNYADGHLEDFSVGASREEVEYTEDKVSGKITKTVTRSKLFEGSAVIVGADPNAKVVSPAMRAYISPHEVKEEEMEKLRQKLIERGMPESVEGEAVFDWISENVERKHEEKPVVDDSVLDLLRSAKADFVIKKKDDEKTTIQRTKEEILQRINDIDELCRKHGIDEKQQKEWRESDLTIDEISRKALDVISERSTGVPIGNTGRIEHGAAQREKFYEAARSGVIQRAATGLNPQKALKQSQESGDADSIKRSQSLVNDFEKPAEGHEQFRNVGLCDLARMFLEEMGERNVHLLPKQEIARRAIAIKDFVTRSGDGPAYNTTGSFSNLMLDAANKTLLAAYDEAMVTYPIWTRRAPSVSDFKNVNRIRFGELSDPEVIPENGEYPEKQTSDARESYAVEKYGELFSISLEAVINDDMNAISRIPAMQGAAMRRKINKVVYSVLTDNAALSDGNTLFHATEHNANLDTTALAVGALNTGWNIMATQSGLNSDTILNLQPRYLIIPSALSATALQLTNSMADPSNAAASTEDASRPNFNSGTVNLYGPNGPRQLVTVVDGQLDGTSTTGWYLAADPSQVDTVEVTFLQGEEAPVLAREEGFTTDTVKYKIRQSFAAKAIDFRGLYQGNT